MEKEYIEDFIVVRIKDIDNVKVLFKEDLPCNWNGIVAQNNISGVLGLLFENYEVELHGRYKKKEG